MKIRTGFVSNSSSSSFVAIIKKDDYDNMRKNMSAFEKAVVDFIQPTKTKAFGLDVIELGWMNGNINSFEDLDCSELMEIIAKDEKLDLDDEDVVDELDGEMWDRIEAVKTKIEEIAEKLGYSYCSDF